MPKISIVIPVFNVIEYLEVCVASIINQHIQDIEIILVDDGSTDGSGLKCDELEKLDHRIKVFHQSNKGVSGARNKGIENSTGDYLYFIDGDDWMHTDVLCNLKYGADIIIGGFYKEANDTTYLNYRENYTNPALSVVNGDLQICMGSFMVKRELIERNNIAFSTDYKYGEDGEFQLKAVLTSTSLEIDNRVWVTYRKNPNSAMYKVNLRQYDCCFTILNLIEYAKNQGNEETSDLLRYFSIAEAMVITSQNQINQGMKYSKMIAFFREHPVLLRALAVSSEDKRSDRFQSDAALLCHHPLQFYIKKLILGKYYKFRQSVGELKYKIIKKFK